VTLAVILVPRGLRTTCAGEAYIVPGASHRPIARTARPGSVPVVEHWVMCRRTPHNKYGHDFVSQPPRNRACDFHRTRLLGFTTWSWALPPQSTTVAAYGYRENPTSTFSQPLGGFSIAVGAISCPTSAPFRVGYYPSQPVMASRCLSAAGLRVLRPPFPTEEFGCPCGWLTGEARPHWGYHVPHHREATGVGAFYTPGSWCPRKRRVGTACH
jgi:hypothetical protein